MTAAATEAERPAAYGLGLTGRIGLTAMLVVMGLAAFGPFLAPHSPTAFIGIPFDPPTLAHPLGLDHLGRDGLSRMMHGGYMSLLIAATGATAGSLIGIICGVWAAYARGALEAIFGRVTETLLAFPSIMIIILLGAATGGGILTLVIAVSISVAPRIGRLARAATLNVRDSAYIEVARSRGESAFYIVGREILPNLSGVLLVDYGIRTAGATLLVASASFLGLGIQPPAADWGLMIRENAMGLTFQPFVSLGPIAAICMLLIGFSLFLDDLERRMSDRSPGE